MRMQHPRQYFALPILLALTTSAARADHPPAYPVVEPPAELKEALDLAPSYRNFIDCCGFPVLGSEKVSDHAMREAAYLIDRMLEGRDDIRRAMAENKVRFVVMAPSEMTTDVPEHSDLTPKRYWDRRARGLGATRARPAVSCGEENLLRLPGDPYAAENILVHEFSHAIHEMGLREVGEDFDGRLRRAYEQAKAEGLWEGTYAATNPNEYWAEGVQSWFDTNRPPDGSHNHVDTREELKEYDPRLAALIAEVFGDRPWRYVRPEDREPSERAHLAGFDRSRAAPFAWPAASEEGGGEDGDRP